MKFDFSQYTEDRLARHVDDLARELIAAQREQNSRQYRRLAAAYGHELSLIRDVTVATRVGPSGDLEIIWCFYCGERAGWQKEHKTPRSRGGSDDRSNIVPSCSTCNYAKGTMDLEEYRASLERRHGQPRVFAGERKT